MDSGPCVHYTRTLYSWPSRYQSPLSAAFETERLTAKNAIDVGLNDLQVRYGIYLFMASARGHRSQVTSWHVDILLTVSLDQDTQYSKPIDL